MPHPLTAHIEEKVFSVTEYLDLVNELLSPLRVFVEGEVSDLKILPQWVFFSLKDAESGSILRCGLHSGVYRKLGVNIEDGMMVKVSGYGKLAPKTGNFGFWVSSIEPLGEGALRRAYELLVQKLHREGLFDRKRTLPDFISHIGVISSRNGVVIQDLMQNLEPLGIKVDFVHSGVEGADSARELLQAIAYFSKTKHTPQVLVVIRGGGSLESLQGFNNEEVVRALFASSIPVLVGIGHDVDAPIATLVADWSASTPTAVAHVINDSWSPVTERVPILREKIRQRFTERLRGLTYASTIALQGIKHAMSRVLTRFTAHSTTLLNAHRRFALLLESTQERVGTMYRATQASTQRRIESATRLVAEYERLLQASDPQKILDRGFGLVYAEDGSLVRHVQEVTIGSRLRVMMKGGSIESRVEKTTPNA